MIEPSLWEYHKPLRRTAPAKWEQVLEELEELDDIRAYDAAKSELSPSRSIKPYVKYGNSTASELHGRDPAPCTEATFPDRADRS